MTRKTKCIVGFLGVAIGLVVFPLLNQKTNKQSVEKTIDKLLVQSSPSMKEDNGLGSNNTSSKTSVLGKLSKDRRLKVRNCIKYIEEQEKLGQAIGDLPQEGMVSPEILVKRAFMKVRSTSDPERFPHIVLVDNFYVVSLWKHPNPFRAGGAGFDLRMGFDAWTGEYISGLSGGGGIISLTIDKKTGAGLTGEVPEAKEYKKRVFDCLKELGMRVFYGRPWNSEIKPNMIAPEESIRIARKQVADRDFDPNKEPLAILVDDLYIVTFWKKGVEKLPDGWKSYDSRVGIDAYTGEFIAMEITRKRTLPPENGEGSKTRLD